MTRTFHCPQCKRALGVDSSVPQTAEVECPLCDHRFALQAIYLDNLPRVRVIDSAVDRFEPASDSEKNSVFESDISGGRETVIDAVELEILARVNDGSTDDVEGLVTQSVLPANSIGTSNTTHRTARRASPIVHLLGIVFFGFVGLLLGLAILCFFGKAEPIIQILPDNSLQEWLEEMNHLGGRNQR